MAPFDKDAPVAEAQEKVEPTKEPEVSIADQLRAMNVDQLVELQRRVDHHIRDRMMRERRCDCGVGRAELMQRESLLTRPGY